VSLSRLQGEFKDAPVNDASEKQDRRRKGSGGDLVFDVFLFG